ncbi:unnamed protein product [Moneuplotes crassus]|uniref:Mannosyltransferase n=1 Tax=Euplotes crassus TaxID=5936 RepID=A0AAD1U9L9_EUPCR|nr:unnamed protein product [Moneuplotes crassus]
MFGQKGWFNPENQIFWIILFAFKVLLALNTRPVYQNDEFTQSTHVAYDIVYGSGHQTWEWMEEFSLRPVFYPMLFAFQYKLLNIFYLDFAVFIIYLPHFLHVVLWQISDLYLYYVVKEESKVHEDRRSLNKNGGYAKLTLLILMNCFLTNVFMPRTSTNAFEGLLLPIGLYYWRKVESDNTLIDLNAIRLTVAVVIAFIIRPTSVLAWLVPMGWKVFAHKTFLKFFICGIIIAVPMMIGSVILDSLYYGKFTSTHYNFIDFNVLQGGSGDYFGKRPIWEYMIYMILIMGPMIIFVFIGLRNELIAHITMKRFPLLFSVFCSYVGFMSLISHKEVRFLVPMCSLLSYLAASGLKKYLTYGKYVIIIYIGYSTILLLGQGFTKSFAYLGNDYINSYNYESAYWCDNEGSSFLLDLNPGMHNENNPKILANDRIYPFALQYHDEPYLASHDKYTICFDAVLDWQKQVNDLRVKARAQVRDTSNNTKSFSNKLCENSLKDYPMPEYFVLRYYIPSNLMLRKIEQWMENPFLIEEFYEERQDSDTSEPIPKKERKNLLPYKKVYTTFRKAWATRCRPHIKGGPCLEYLYVYKRQDEGCHE